MTDPGAVSPRIVIHVGEPKTGTTFLQHLIFANRETLAGYGVLFPGARPMAHWRATQDLREVVQIPNDPIGPFKGAWDRLVGEAMRAERIGVVSHELLAAADRAQAERAVRSFLDAGADVHVVVTVRDIGTLLPAEWQETVKHRSVRSWTDWLGDVIDAESGAPDRRKWWFWKVHDTLGVVDDWGHLLPARNVHVITVPRSGSSPTLLWERFAGLLGVDPSVVSFGSERVNASLGMAEVEVLRKINEKLPENLPNWFYMWHVKESLAHKALADRGTRGRLALPAERDEWAAKYAEALVAELASSGYDIVGDLDELLPAPPAGTRVSPADASPSDMVDAGVDAVVALLEELATAKNVGGRETRPEQSDLAGRRFGTRRAGAAVKRRLISYGNSHMWAFRVRRRYWQWANDRRSGRSTGHSDARRDGG